MSKQVKIIFKGVNNEERQSVLNALKQIGLSEISSCHDGGNNWHKHRLVINGSIKGAAAATSDNMIELEGNEILYPFVER